MALRNDIEIPYALREGAIVHVSEVDRGLDCGCVCARCGDALVARKGSSRQHHFAHYQDSDCSGAAESLLHRLAKELLSSAKSLALPAYIFRAKSKPRYGRPAVSIERKILAARRMSISSVAVEQPLGSMVPDLLLRSEGTDMILEIAVSHRVDRAKMRHLRRMNIPALELSLKAEDLLLSRAELSKRLVEETSIKSWLFHPSQRSAEGEWIKARRKHPRQYRPVISRIDAAVAKLRSLKRENSNWRRYNDWAENFNRKHGRYPNLEENQAFERSKRWR